MKITAYKIRQIRLNSLTERKLSRKYLKKPQKTSNHGAGVPFKVRIRTRQFVYELRINSSPETRHLVRRSLLRHFNKIYDCDLNGVLDEQKMYRRIPAFISVVS